MDLLRPDRLRTIERPFGWAPSRLATAGWLAQLELPAKALYLGLCLVADRRGLSYWSAPRLQALLGLDADALRTARDELLGRDLLAFDGTRYQLLSLPGDVVRPPRPARLPTRCVAPAPPQEPEPPASPEHVAAILAPLMAKLREPEP